ncbi:hypothetical protein cypCar_00014530 [Cyprinus carpio]|nr:hypothetical protein cypCar_00014530 [Cyprinus carpio]
MSQIPMATIEEYFHHEDGALDLLRELKDFNMTLKLLQDTRIGMSVNRIRKHCTNEDVVNLAKILIKNWKKLLESAQNQKSERSNEVKNGNHPSKPSGSPNRTSPERGSRKDAPVDFFPPASINSHPPLRRSSVDVKKERRDAPHPLFPLHHHIHPPPIPIPKRSSEVKKERKDPPETLAPPAPTLSSPPPPKRPSLEEPKERAKTAPDPNAPLPPLPFHLHPPQKREMKKERKEMAEPSAPLPPVPLHLQPPTPMKRPSLDAKKDKEKERKDSTDSKKLHSRKLSLDGWTDSKSKPETPKTPTTPTSPLSPSFSSGVGPLSPRLQTGDPIRDKCIEMLTAALRTDDDYKDYGANCEGMAAEIEDHILRKHMC